MVIGYTLKKLLENPAPGPVPGAKTAPETGARSDFSALSEAFGQFGMNSFHKSTP